MARILGRNGRGIARTTKADLIKMLERYDDDAIIVLGYTGADHWRTPCVAGISKTHETELVQTAYSVSGFAEAGEEDEDAFVDEDCLDEEPLTVVVLS